MKIPSELIISCFIGLSATLQAQQIDGDIERERLKSLNDSNSIIIAKDKKTKYVIFIAKEAPNDEKYAANELAVFLKQITGADFFIVDTVNIKKQSVIAIGPQAAKRILPDIDLIGLGQDGIIIHTTPEYNVVLSGGENASRGTLYAVYTFLEDIAGCRWWSPTESDIPKLETLAFAPCNIRYVPAFQYREPFIFEAFNPAWAVRNKINGRMLKDYNHYKIYGGSIDYCNYGGPWFAHTFNKLAPPEIYFTKHPEWYSEIKGKRVGPPENTQLLW